MKPGGQRDGLLAAFGHAFAGVAAASHERNFRIELCFALVAIVLGVAFGNTLEQWLVVVVCIGLVLGAECLNTAIEKAVDLACSNEDPRAKVAKDAAAGAVLLVSVASLVVGVALYAPPLLSLVLGGVSV